MKRFDERDVLFARMAYEKDSPEYEDYYQRNPEKKAIDDDLRNLPNLLTEGTKTFERLNSPLGVATFKFLADIKPLVEGNVNHQKTSATPEEMTTKVKSVAKYYGADLVGITKLCPEDYYSHRGRDAYYGEKIDQHHKYGIVFAVEMDRQMINRAPQVGEAIEVTKGYLKAAIIGMILSYYLRELGYPARNHMDGNYLLIAPLVAANAGLGEIGRMGLLVTKKFGPRVRLGIVSTDLDLISDQREDFGLPKFCEICQRCAKYCPGRAISDKSALLTTEGVSWAKVDHERCYRIWRKLGTDCGICLANCPFSHNIDLKLIEKIPTDPEVIREILKQKSKKRDEQSSDNWL